jgi:magnesium chelatase family protein
MHVEVPRVPLEALRMSSTQIESTAVVAERVKHARQVQMDRQGGANARLTNREVDRLCNPTPAAITLLERASLSLGLSARAHHRVLKLARTIADLGESSCIEPAHVGEALTLRRLDRARTTSGGGLPAPLLG